MHLVGNIFTFKPFFSFAP